MIKAVVFDCFGVLQVNSGEYFLQSHTDNYDELYPEISQVFRAGDYGLMSQADINQAVADITGIDLGLVAANIQGTSVRNDELMQYMSKLRQTYKVAMLSNIGPGSMDQFFSPSERKELFDAVVLSGEEYTIKPYPRIYEICAERLGVSTSECVMVDDSIDNCHGADAAGMQYVHYRNNHQAVSEIERILGV